MTISFQNEGLIDTRAITTFGVSSKDGENPIGYFGTGLKYAISIILRAGGDISIWRGLEELRFTKEWVKVRNDEFEMIKMNDQELGFTTHLGRNWEMWQAFRELYCNTLDERGDTAGNRLEPMDSGTTVHVSNCPEFEECYSRRSEIVLSSKPLAVCDGVEIHAGHSKAMYYRGILAGELQQPSVFTYNVIHPCVLTEDRTFKSEWQPRYAITRGVLHGLEDNLDLLTEILTAPKDTFENRMDLGHLDERPSEAWLERAAAVVRDLSTPRNLSLQGLMEKYGKASDDVGEVMLTPIEEEQLARAVHMVKALGYDDLDPRSIAVVRTLGSTVLGRMVSGRILLSRRVFEMGTKMVAGTVMEEHLHKAYHFEDETRDFQNYLIDKIVTLGEQHVLKEVL